MLRIRRRTTFLVATAGPLMLSCLAGCDANLHDGSGHGGSAQPGLPPATAAAIHGVPRPAPESSADERVAPSSDGQDRPGQIAAKRHRRVDRLRADRVIADTYLDGSLPVDLVSAGQIIIDATGLGPAESVNYLVAPGQLTSDQLADGKSLVKSTAELEGRTLTLLAGEDRDRPLVLRDRKAGLYTVCVQHRPVGTPIRGALPFDPDAVPRCRVVEINDEEPTSRVVEFER